MTRIDVIKEHLLLDTAIVNLITARVYNQDAPTQVTNPITGVSKKTPFPYIVIKQIGSQSSDFANSDIRRYIYAIECLNKIGLVEAETLAKHVKNALNNSKAYNDTHAETIMMYGKIKSETNYSQEEGGDKIYQCDVNVEITFKETI